ncbi:unnamed protein product [Rotaria sp. Silwood1]|nr:unnamed protein product [Rotaria sp. Silwood1]CAF4934674.1 unnamed protein product [Rotaria sp. Silwood1]CAF4962880.1 unnamed protein product [Rotaria sp. Silwood1]
MNQEEAQLLYNQMRQITKNDRVEAMALYEQASAREHELIANEIKQIIESFSQTNTEDEVSFAAFKQYHELREKRLNIEAEKSLYFLSEQKADIVLRKSDKSKVFHLGKLEDYQEKSKEYMDRTQAYKCLGKEDPLADLIKRTNKYLLNLRLAKWITQKQYELLTIKPNEVELAHLYYLPKAHKPNTPLRPIISGLKHPTIKISKYLDDLLRPLFDKMAKESTVTSGFELLKKVEEWSKLNINQQTLFCTIDVVDLYTMIPQTEDVLSLKKMLDYLKLKQVGGLKLETIIRLENRNGILFTKVYQKPSYEPYYLPFNSIHPIHMKKNIPFTMLLRLLRYCSTFESYIEEREKLRVTLLLNKHSNKIIEQQFLNLLTKYNIDQPLNFNNYCKYRKNSYQHF